jgi:hypothetical protein
MDSERSLLTLVPKSDYVRIIICLIQAKPIYVFVCVCSWSMYNPIVVAFHRSPIHGVKLDIQGFGLKGQEIGSCHIVE